MKCEHCPVPADVLCLVEVWGGIRPHCQWIAEGREDVRLAILNDSTGVKRPVAQPSRPTPRDYTARARILSAMPPIWACRWALPLPADAREGCGCSRWCAAGRSHREDRKVDRSRCDECAAEPDTPFAAIRPQLPAPHQETAHAPDLVLDRH